MREKKIALLVLALVTSAVSVAEEPVGESSLGAAQQEEDFTIPKTEPILLYTNKKLSKMKEMSGDLYLFHSNQLKWNPPKTDGCSFACSLDSEPSYNGGTKSGTGIINLSSGIENGAECAYAQFAGRWNGDYTMVVIVKFTQEGNDIYAQVVGTGYPHDTEIKDKPDFSEFIGQWKLESYYIGQDPAAGRGMTRASLHNVRMVFEAVEAAGLVITGEPEDFGGVSPTCGVYTDYEVGSTIAIRAEGPVLNAEGTMKYSPWAYTVEKVDFDGSYNDPVQYEATQGTVVFDGDMRIRWLYTLVSAKLDVHVFGADSSAVTVTSLSTPDDDGFYPADARVTLTANQDVATFVAFVDETGAIVTTDASCTVSVLEASRLTAKYVPNWTYDPETQLLSNEPWVFKATANANNELTLVGGQVPAECGTDESLHLESKINNGAYTIIKLDDNFLDYGQTWWKEPMEELRNLYLPDTIKTVGSNCVRNNKKIQHLEWDSGICETIGAGSFWQLEGMNTAGAGVGIDLRALKEVNTIFGGGDNGGRTFYFIINGKVTLNAVTKLNSQWSFEYAHGITDVEIDSPGLVRWAGESFYGTWATNLVVRAPLLRGIPSNGSGAPCTTSYNAFNSNNRMVNMELYCDNLESIHKLSSEGLKTLTLASLKAVDTYNDDNSMNYRSLRVATFPKMKPTERFLRDMLTEPADYQVALRVSGRTKWGWSTCEAIRRATPEERAKASFPVIDKAAGESLMGVYTDETTGKHAWVIRTDPCSLTLSIR